MIERYTGILSTLLGPEYNVVANGVVGRTTVYEDPVREGKRGISDVEESVRSANDFMESLAFRKKTLLLACQQIVRLQKDFFEKGPRYLKPLRQKDIAAIINVHEATISRMANEKYLRCSQGLFKLSFFFTNAVGQNLPETEEIPASKQGVMAELEKILEEHKDDKKALSDQKIADILLERGIKIARRTVAKYRSQLNIDSSYSRQ